LKKFPNVIKGRALLPSLLNNILGCFKEEMGLFQAGVVLLYYGNEFRRIIFRVLGKSWAEYAWRELHGRTLRRSGKKNADHTWIERR